MLLLGFSGSQAEGHMSAWAATRARFCDNSGSTRSRLTFSTLGREVSKKASLLVISSYSVPSFRPVDISTAHRYLARLLTIRAFNRPIDSLHPQAEQRRIKWSRGPLWTTFSPANSSLVWFQSRSVALDIFDGFKDPDSNLIADTPTMNRPGSSFSSLPSESCSTCAGHKGMRYWVPACLHFSGMASNIARSCPGFQR